MRKLILFIFISVNTSIISNNLDLFFKDENDLNFFLQSSHLQIYNTKLFYVRNSRNNKYMLRINVYNLTKEKLPNILSNIANQILENISGKNKEIKITYNFIES